MQKMTERWWTKSKNLKMEKYSMLKDRLNIVNMSFLPNLIYRFNGISIKILASYFVDTDKIILNFKWRSKRDPK